MSRRRTAARLAGAGGVCLVLAGSTGSSALWDAVLARLASGLPGAFGAVLLALAVVLGVLAGLGGFTVLLGAWLIRRRSARLGAFVVGLGAGGGLLGLAFNLALVLLAEGDVRPFFTALFATLGGLGVALSVAGATAASPVPVRAWWRWVRRR